MSLLTEILTGVAAAPVTAAVAAYFRYRLTRVREQNKTARLTTALDGTDPAQRAAIIEACGSLERTPKRRRLRG
ncbi:hypothetical protein Afil01_40900 [Actinorhabdospora filicis]|uniref:Uncharacterized protein n=1 Tax=Actinorhabdospora filicis TaxID=1785913 RepID=A0A9W6WAR2_9ACTN|nr:hypothetical protein [Actinorhabdospora filicis]GLZ79283.1 hypothetical protein Afil01_40900 [Actinorhabdospora filicis]